MTIETSTPHAALLSLHPKTITVKLPYLPCIIPSFPIILGFLFLTAKIAVAESIVTYEEFGAKGDGITDDLPAICQAHEHANKNNLAVKSKADATYHLGSKPLTAIIATDTDWNSSRFIIDDTAASINSNKPIFDVRSLSNTIPLKITNLKRGQKSLAARPPTECLVFVENNQKKLYIRKGLNQNSGSPQREVFILNSDGSIADDIDWDYDSITGLSAKPIDKKTLLLKGGVFTNIPNQLSPEKNPHYWLRNIRISRSKTVVDGVTLKIADHYKPSHPYQGFLDASRCAKIVFRNCTIDARKYYKKIGSAGKSVPMGTYGYSANLVSDFRMINCRMGNDIQDQNLWGIVGTNFMKNFLVEDCSLNRVDVHQGVSGKYIIRRTTLGHAGLNAVGRGELIVEDSTIHGANLVRFREDYGSTWEGDVSISNSKWIPKSDGFSQLAIFGISNTETHDFGYPCYMPQNIKIDGLSIDDSRHGKNYQGPSFFGNPLGKSTTKPPFPMHRTKSIEVKNFSTSSKLPFRISDNPSVSDAIKVR